MDGDLKKQENKTLAVYDTSGNRVEVTAEGSLGLLALGYKGLYVWRLERSKKLKSKTNIQNDKV